MAKKVEGFLTHTGQFFTTRAEADASESEELLRAAVEERGLDFDKIQTVVHSFEAEIYGYIVNRREWEKVNAKNEQSILPKATEGEDTTRTKAAVQPKATTVSRKGSKTDGDD